ncbi:MAG: hypothetical protein CL678_05595 [Bdellovibrionaceae bacterium]|jgi:hypothetical protein|nr:hypothetical protein [Pseudobdellovibrionaceae bacterium]|tara:strand:+ start:5676 stop:6107 length:432 start_codon:yes stop_codon:yes gene_type:complete
MGLNPNIWLPNLKFTLQTIAITYPSHPNDVSKRKYYDLIQNLPVFFPFNPMGKNFLDLLDKYPVTPYLSSRMSFMKWIHFIFNKIHEQLDQPIDEFYDSLEKYYDQYKPKEIRNREIIKTRKKYIQFATASIIILVIVYFYKK